MVFYLSPDDADADAEKAAFGKFCWMFQVNHIQELFCWAFKQTWRAPVRKEKPARLTRDVSKLFGSLSVFSMFSVSILLDNTSGTKASSRQIAFNWKKQEEFIFH